MFNKSLFNRNAFDRSVSLPSISAIMSSAGTMRLQPVLTFPLTIRPIAGIGSMKCGIVMQQHIGLSIHGVGDMDDTIVNLATMIRPVRFTGSGRLEPELNVLTPIRSSITSASELKISDRMYLTQIIQSHITSHSTLTTDLILRHLLNPEFEGTSELKGSLTLLLPLSPGIEGSGDLILRRLGAVNENILELINISIPPGGTITIDTDLLQVLIGSTEDVSSITSESVFFELNPGENELTISTASKSTFEVVAIWQNRWL